MTTRSLMDDEEYAIYMREYNRQYQIKNKAKILAQRKEFRDKNVKRLSRDQHSCRTRTKIKVSRDNGKTNM